MAHLKRPLRVLHIEDEKNESLKVNSDLRSVFSRLQLESVREEYSLVAALCRQEWDLVVCDFDGRINAHEALRLVKNSSSDIPFLLIAGNIGEEKVASLMKEGVDDFILRGNYQRLQASVKRLIIDRAMRSKAERAQRKAFEAFASRQRMLAIVSHDIKNPLSAIHLEAQMLMKTVDKHGKSVMGEEVKVQAKRILNTAERMKELLVDLLDKNRGSGGLKKIQKSQVDPVQLFFESLDNVRPLVAEKNIRLKFHPKENIPSLSLDRNKIYQVFSNLLNNAIKFTPHGGEIHFDLSWDDDRFYFTFTDTGRGLPIGEEEKVFEKFWTGKGSSHSGTGLGLFICRTVIEAHGGTISCGNVNGKGASFTFTLPREKAVAEDGVTGEIFVVDDDEDLCEVMTWSLKKEGFRVRAFHSGEAALRALTRSKPAVLIVDYHLGDMNGCEFLTKRRLICPDCPVILVSGSPDEVACSAPAGEYVTIVEKPLDLEGLLREVKALSAPCSAKSSNEASMHISHGPASAG